MYNIDTEDLIIGMIDGIGNRLGWIPRERERRLGWSVIHCRPTISRSEHRLRSNRTRCVVAEGAWENT